MGILKFLTSLLHNEGENSITFYKLYTRLTNWSSKRMYPYPHELPKSILLTSEFWTEAIRLYKSTRGDGLERAISVFWADGELVLSSAITGTTKSVNPSSNIRVSYTPKPKSYYLTREIYLDERRISQKEIYYKNVPKNVKVHYLFNMHTHPPHRDFNGGQIYSFFSAQDIRSLIGSGATITGMIGDKLWILFRTAGTPTSVSDLEDRDVTIQNLWKRYKIVTYSAEFKERLRLVTDVGNQQSN